MEALGRRRSRWLFVITLHLDSQLRTKQALQEQKQMRWFFPFSKLRVRMTAFV